MTRKISSYPRYNEKCEIFVETSDIVFGVAEDGRGQRRTPLARKFTDARGARSLVNRDAWRNLSRFTAIGSRAQSTREHLHLPLLDADYGARVESAEIKDRFYPSRPARRCGDYSRLTLGAEPTNIDTLSDDFSAALRELGAFDFKTLDSTVSDLDGEREQARSVSLVVPLGAVAVLESAQDGHVHVFMQTPVSKEAHRALMEGFVDLGVISARWAFNLSSPTHGTILRTPWTPKAREDGLS